MPLLNEFSGRGGLFRILPTGDEGLERLDMVVVYTNPRLRLVAVLYHGEVNVFFGDNVIRNRFLYVDVTTIDLRY